jgi:hypothetical protein
VPLHRVLVLVGMLMSFFGICALWVSAGLECAIEDLTVAVAPFCELDDRGFPVPTHNILRTGWTDSRVTPNDLHDGGQYHTNA